MTGSVLLCAFGHSAVHQYRDVSEHESSIFHRYEYVLLGNADQLRDSALSLGSELTEDFDERTRLRTYAASLMGVGTLIATSGTLMVVDFYTKLFGSVNAGWAGMGLTYGILIIAAYNICCMAIKNREPENPNLGKKQKRQKKRRRNAAVRILEQCKARFPEQAAAPAAHHHLRRQYSSDPGLWASHICVYICVQI